MNHSSNTTYYNVTNSTTISPATTTITDIKLWFAIFMSFCIVGAIQNFSMMVVVWTNPSLRKGCGVLIIHLSLVYGVLFVLHYPIYAVLTLIKHTAKWEIQQKWCPYIVMPQMMFSFVANWTDVSLAVNRLMAICFPHAYQRCYRRYNKISMTMTLVIIWVLNFGLAVPPCFEVGGIFMSSTIASCQWVPRGQLSTMISGLGVQYSLALAGGCYVVVLLKAGFTTIRSRNAVGNNQQTREMRVMKKRISLVLVLFVSYLAYCACYLPASVIGVYYQPLIRQTPVLYLWLRTVFLGGAAVTPMIFWVMNKDYRKGLRRMLCGGEREVNPSKATLSLPTAPAD